MKYFGKRKLGRVQAILSENVFELRLLVLMVMIGGFLVAGRVAMQKNQYQRYMGHRALVEIPFLSNEELAEYLGVTFMEPWEMTETDLHKGRVIYNLMTKPGYRWLVAEMGVMVVAMWVLVRSMKYFFGWQKAQVGKVVAVAREVGERGVEVRIAGSVAIGARKGVIYLANEFREDTTQEVYGFYYTKLAVVRLG